MNAGTALPRLSGADLERILAVTRRLAAPFELPSLLSEVTAAACQVLHAERASVWLHDAAVGELVLTVASDLRELRIPLSHGLVGACARDRVPVNVPDCHADARFDSTVDCRSGFHTRCALTMPLIDHEGTLVGVLQMLNKQGGVIGAADQALAEALAAQCAVALARVRLKAQAIEAALLRHELALAQQVQQAALPKALPVVPGYELHATFRPAAQTGGDGYDLATVGGQLLVLLADATGHGVAPALSVLQMQAMLRLAFQLGGRLEEVFRAVNDRLANSLPDGHFVTAFVGLLDPATHRLRFISGGQAPILHFRASENAFTVHKATSFPMGAMTLPAPRAAVETTLAHGDLLLLLSDGIYETEDPAGAMFGRARVEQVVQAHHGEGVAALSARLFDAVQQFAAGAAQQDDITTVLVRRLPGKPG
jgi:phosphoserine phosphatase RsbU/P